MKYIYDCKTEKETEKLAAALSQITRAGDVWALFGTLGMGKSVFARAFIKSLTGTEEVPSPTFTLVQTYPAADFEGIISVKNGVIINGVNFTKEEMSAVVTAMTAGAAVNESNTNKVIEGGTDLIEKYTNTEIIAALQGGEFVFTTNQRGEVKVEQDINSYHTFIADKNYAFSKNRVLRVLDEIGTSVKDIWEQSFMGKVDNNADGRDIFKSNLNDYFIQLQNISAIQNWGGVDDIEISQGADLDSVIVGVYVQPVDAMEKLYMTVNVIG